ncbi:Cuticle Protein CPAP1 [Hyalella azteca]|uniref:Cuticle Protein CPAP1 n=1 Tax=Hyalella azteca TaxID=294128 RepID=A0A6A0GVE2_HYAAZ|nr:U-scoloptoxin(01)-Cw1a [Hyalella azteca]KAA0189847.1 Cuticle Protein CPAP1 [Hyalella azteca]
MKVILVLAAIVCSVAGHGAYRFSDGYLDVLGGEPSQSFSCDGRPYGYYADVDNDCEIFHVCWPVEDDAGAITETAQYSFFCGNQTVFSQDTLSCAHPEDAFPCDQAAGYYDIVNAEFGRIPDAKA